MTAEKTKEKHIELGFLAQPRPNSPPPLKLGPAIIMTPFCSQSDQEEISKLSLRLSEDGLSLLYNHSGTAQPPTAKLPNHQPPEHQNSDF